MSKDQVEMALAGPRGSALPGLRIIPFPRTRVSSAVATRRTELAPPFAAVVAAVMAAALAAGWSVSTHSMLLYGDARAHLNVARRVTDGLRTGPTQLGSVWLPLPHLLLVPLVALRPLWHSGAAGALVGGVCFVYSALRIFTLVEDLSGSQVAAWCAFGVFTINLNMLYIQTTSLTEPVLVALFVGTVYYLARWMRTLSVRDLLWAAVFTFGATLTRYEGWALLCAGVAVVVIWSWLSDYRQMSGQANFVLYGVVGTYGIALWLIYNLTIFHDPLYFLRSAYSAQAINGSQAQFGLLGTKGNLLETVLTYGWDMIDIIGAPVLIMAALSAAALLVVRDRARRRVVFTFALLLAPVAFEFLTLYIGQTTIRVPQRAPHGMWNVRYGLMVLPFCAIAVGTFVGRWRKAVPLVAAATALATVTMALGVPLALADGRSGTSSAAAGHPEKAAAYLHQHYQGGEVLADDSAASAFMFAADLDLKDFVTVGFHPFWEEAIASPGDNVAWAVTFPNDAISADMAAHGDRFARFRQVLKDGEITIYQRAPAPAVGQTARSDKSAIITPSAARPSG